MIIVTSPEYHPQLSQFIAEEGKVREGLKIDVVVAEDMMGSADGLRAVKDRIRGGVAAQPSFCIHNLIVIIIYAIYLMAEVDP